MLLAAAILLLLGVNFTTFLMIRRTAEFNDRVEHIQEMRRAVRGTLITMLDAESAKRAFLLTAHPEYLQLYRAARDRMPASLDNLAAASEGDLAAEAGVEAIIRLQRDKFLDMEQTLALAQSGQIGGAIQQMRSGHGKRLMDALRDETSALDDDLSDRLEEQTRRSERSAQVTLAVNAVAAVLILVLAGIVLMLIRRYVGDINRARDDLDRINAGLEETIRARTAALTRANEEVQRFAYIVSHDLRSPLVNVMGYTSELKTAGEAIDRQLTRVETAKPDLIEQEAITAARQDIPESIGFIRASTEKMDRLINAILKLSREGRRALVPETLDMTRMVETIADTVRHQLDSADAEVVVEPLPEVESDRLSMEQIIGNLIDNAVKYLDRQRPGRIVVSGRDLPGGWVEYAVADNGRGIAQRDHERIFELFRRSGRQDRAGEGLGLAFVRNSVRRLGGEITVESVLGEGSTFRLKFPKRLVVEEAGDLM